MIKRILSLVIVQIMIISMAVCPLHASAEDSYVKGDLVWPKNNGVAEQTSIDGMSIGDWIFGGKSWADKKYNGSLANDQEVCLSVIDTDTAAYGNKSGRGLLMYASDNATKDKGLYIQADMKNTFKDGDNFVVNYRILPTTPGFYFMLRTNDNGQLVPIMKFDVNNKLRYYKKHEQYCSYEVLCTYDTTTWYDVSIEVYPATPSGSGTKEDPHTDGTTYKVTVSDGTNTYTTGLQSAQEKDKYFTSPTVDASGSGFYMIEMELYTLDTDDNTNGGTISSVVKDLYVYELDKFVPELSADVAPANGSKELTERNDFVKITPSNAMKPETVTDANITAKKDGVSTPITVSMSGNDIVVTFTDFDYYSTYTIEIGDAVVDTYGQKLNEVSALDGYSVSTQLDPDDLQVLFEEKFDNSTQEWGVQDTSGGEWPDFRLGGTEDAENPYVNIDIVNNSEISVSSYTTGKSLKMSLNGCSNVTSLFTYKTFTTPISEGDLFIKTKVNVSTQNAGFYIEGRNSNGSKSTYILRFNTDGNVQYAGSDTGYYAANSIPNFKYQANTWYDIEIAIRPDAEQGSMFDLNIYESATGECVATIKDQPYVNNSTRCPDVNMIYFGVNGIADALSTVYVDEFIVQYAPGSFLWEFKATNADNNTFTGNSVTASVKLNGRNETSDKTARIIIASYTEEGRLVDIKASDIITAYSRYNALVPGELTLDNISNTAKTVKVYLWNGVNNLMPVAEPITLTRAE